MYKGKTKVKEPSRARLFLIGLGISLGTLFGVSLIMSAIAYSSPDPTGKIGIFSLVSLIISSLIAGLLHRRLYRGRGMGMGALTALATTLIMLIFGAIISGGHLGLSAVMNYLSYLGIGLLSALIPHREGGKRKRRKY